MAIRNCLSAILVFFLFFAAPPSEASLLSQQYTSVWTASDFFPIQSPVFRIGSVKIETGHDASFDMLGYLSEQTRQQLTSQGSLHEHFCKKLGLDPHAHGAQTTKDGSFTVEFVDCLASCGTAPVMMCNDAFHEGVTEAKAEEIFKQCQ